MNLKKLSSLTGLVFGLILFIGALYVLIAGLIFVRTFPGVVMFLIYLYDAVRGAIKLNEIASMHLLMATVVFWGLSMVMITGIVKAVKNTIGMVRRTGRFINGLKIIKAVGSLNYFDSPNGEIFTAGFINPKVYVSTSLGKLHTKKEIRAMIAHEQRHAKASDPLRTTLASMVGKMLPGTVIKEKLIRYFYTLTEVCADKAAEISMADKKPVVSALYKRLKMANEVLATGINFFNSQSERIGILVGKKRIDNVIWETGTVMALGMIILGWVMAKFNFYNCGHLLRCLLSFSSTVDLH